MIDQDYKVVLRQVKEKSINEAQKYFSIHHVQLKIAPHEKRVSTELALPSIEHSTLADVSAHFGKTQRLRNSPRELFELEVNRSSSRFIEKSVSELQTNIMNSTVRQFIKSSNYKINQRQVPPRLATTVAELEIKLGSVLKEQKPKPIQKVPALKKIKEVQEPVELPTPVFFEESLNTYSYAVPGRGEGGQICCVRDKIFLYGGQTGNGLTSDVWQFDMKTSQWTNFQNSFDLLRTDHTLIAWKQYLVLYGGSAQFDQKMKIRQVYANMGFYNTVTGAWSVTFESLEPRRQHKVALLQNKYMVITGGLDAGDQPLTDTVLYALESRRFVGNKIYFTEGIAHHAMATGYDYKRSCETVYLFGGKTKKLGSFPLQRLILVATQPQFWEIVTGAGQAPKGRYNHTMECIDDQLIIVGGKAEGSEEFQDTIFVFNLQVSAWCTVQRAGLHTLRWGHASCVSGSQIICFGGIGETAYLPAYLYSIETDSQKIRGKIIVMRKLGTEQHIQTDRIGQTKINDSPKRLCRLEKFRNNRKQYERTVTYMPMPQLKAPKMRYDLLLHFVKKVLLDIGYI